MTNTLTQTLGVKLVINTQHMESYGEHWKPKGGSVYIVTDKSLLSSAESLEEIRGLIGHSNEYSEEYIRGEELVSADATVCEHWETLNEITRGADGDYRVKSVKDNRDHGSMRHQIAFVTREAPLADGINATSDYTIEYELTNGRTAHNDAELRAELINMGVKF